MGGLGFVLGLEQFSQGQALPALIPSFKYKKTAVLRSPTTKVSNSSDFLDWNSG